MMRSLVDENRRQRGSTGQGQPGLFKLLGGGLLEADENQQAAFSSGRIGAVSSVAPAYVDQRLAGIRTATGNLGGGGGGVGGGGGGFGNRNPYNRERLK